MAKTDYYDVLGVGQKSSAEELKKAFRKKAMQFHPDRNQGNEKAEQKFKEVNEAYDILKDDQKRAAYDQFGHAAFEGGSGAGGFSSGGFGGGFADIFDEMFGDLTGRQQGGRNSQGADLRYNLEISLDDAHRGRDTRIRVPSSVVCGKCNGSGAEKGTQPTNCSTCQGRGKVRASQGFFTIERTCPSCHGEGQIITSPCGVCSGTGSARKEKTLEVTIPPGVEDGMRIRLSGEGDAGSKGTAPGDLYIFVSVSAHPLFKREAANIFCIVPLPMTTAALGGSVEVPSIDGLRAKVSIPAGAQTGHRLRLRGKGMNGLHGKGRGDMYIEIQVETPVNLSKVQKDKLREFEATLKVGKKNLTSPESEGFFAKAKEIWGNLKE